MKSISSNNCTVMPPITMLFGWPLLWTRYAEIYSPPGFQAREHDRFPVCIFENPLLLRGSDDTAKLRGVCARVEI